MAAGCVRAVYTLAFGCLWIAAVGAVATAPQQPAPEDAGAFRPPPAPAQPIAFSHRAHVAVGATCVDCHAGATTAEAATIPQAAACMECHATQRRDAPDISKLAAHAASGEVVAWRRVYRLPAYVWFSHAAHMKPDGATCATCHGEVAAMDVMQKVRDTSMAACMACHKQQSASLRCDSCHDEL